MNTLTQTKMFSFVDKVSGVVKTLRELKFDDYTVDYDKYEYLVTYFKGYKFPLTKDVIDNLESMKVRPLLLASPKNKKNSPVLLNSSIPGVVTRFGKDMVAVCDVSIRGNYMVNPQTGDITHFKIGERDFYTLMQGAVVNRYMTLNGSSYEINARFVSAVMEAFTFILYKTLNAIFPLSFDSERSDVSRFIIAVFCLQNFFDMDMDKAKSRALTLKGLDKSTIANNSRLYRSEVSDYFDMRSSIAKSAVTEDMGKVKVFPVDNFFAILNNELSTTDKNRLDYRSVTAKFVSMYGANALLAIEHSVSFLLMMFGASMKVGLYNDLSIDNAVGTYLTDIEKTIISIR